jgi:hypothetical protein
MIKEVDQKRQQTWKNLIAIGSQLMALPADDNFGRYDLGQQMGQIAESIGLDPRLAETALIIIQNKGPQNVSIQAASRLLSRWEDLAAEDIAEIRRRKLSKEANFDFKWATDLAYFKAKVQLVYEVNGVSSLGELIKKVNGESLDELWLKSSVEILSQTPIDFKGGDFLDLYAGEGMVHEIMIGKGAKRVVHVDNNPHHKLDFCSRGNQSCDFVVEDIGNIVPEDFNGIKFRGITMFHPSGEPQTMKYAVQLAADILEKGGALFILFDNADERFIETSAKTVNLHEVYRTDLGRIYSK